MVSTLLVTTQECATMQVLAKGYHMYNCDWLWEKPHLATHEGNYWEICNSIIQRVISWENLKQQAYNLLWIYSYLIHSSYKATHSTMPS